MYHIYPSLEAACEGLFEIQKIIKKGEGSAVSGHLIAADGSVLYSCSNRVLQNIRGDEWRVLDPTCHGEMRLIYWYFANKERLGLPEPQKLTIMTSLDPCIMCASSIVLSGFNLGTVSLDNYAGINYASNAFEDFEFAPSIRKELLRRFGYYRVEGDPSRENYLYEGKDVYFNEGIISRGLEKDIADMFYSTIPKIRKAFFLDCHLKIEQLKNLRDLSEEDELIIQLKKLDKHALTIQLTERVVIDGVATSSFQPNQQLKVLLTNLVSSTPGAKNALALIDPHGSLLLARADRFDITPVHSAIVTAFKEYGKFYFGQASKTANEGVPFQQTKAYFHVPSLHSCTVIFLKALQGDDIVTWQTIGVFSFGLNRPMRAGGLVYIEKYAEKAITVEEVITHFPSFYGKKFINFNPVIAKMTKQAKND